MPRVVAPSIEFEGWPEEWAPVAVVERKRVQNALQLFFNQFFNPGKHKLKSRTKGRRKEAFSRIFVHLSAAIAERENISYVKAAQHVVLNMNTLMEDEYLPQFISVQYPFAQALVYGVKTGELRKHALPESKEHVYMFVREAPNKGELVPHSSCPMYDVKTSYIVGIVKWSSEELKLPAKVEDLKESHAKEVMLTLECLKESHARGYRYVWKPAYVDAFDIKPTPEPPGSKKVPRLSMQLTKGYGTTWTNTTQPPRKKAKHTLPQ
jgi:hypothetical protein